MRTQNVILFFPIVCDSDDDAGGSGKSCKMRGGDAEAAGYEGQGGDTTGELEIFATSRVDDFCSWRDTI